MSLLQSFKQFGWLLERRARAKRYGIPFSRDKNWVMPRQILVAGQWLDLVHPGDEGSVIALKDIFVSDVYWLDRLRKERVRTVLDIGAHVGFFSLAAKDAFPTATIHAYEPNEALWPLLSAHSTSAGFTAIPNAVGSVDGKVNLQAGHDSVYTAVSPHEEGKVKMTAIGDAILRVAGNGPLDLLKMDCEGSEWEILSAHEALRNVRFITMEYHLFPEKTLSQLQQIFQDLGFKIETQQQDGNENGRIFASRRGT